MDAIRDEEVARILKDLREKSADPERRAELERREEEQREAKIAELMGRSEIPKKYLPKSFDTFVVTKANAAALKACREYVQEWQDRRNAQGIALFGDIGVGKTHLAIAVMKELITRYHVPARYANVLHTFERAKWSFDSDGTNPIPPLLSCPFLVLDDLGSERPTSWTLSQVLLIVDYRQGEELPMLITSNATNWSGLMNMLTLKVKGHTESLEHLALPVNRAIDRLREGLGAPLVIKGKSWRGRQPRSGAGGDDKQQ